ncbi:MAG TPA: thioredoxin domain-containing protein [Patescibacteria group bacterium]|nr:thioredoxin domain-containing protein [Patescibacteria group bacterium]
MNPQRRVLLFVLIFFFTALAGVLTWYFVHVAVSEFPAGTRPDIASVKEPAPTLPPIRATDPTRGSPDKQAVTIVEFADFSCTTCRMLEPQLQKALTSSPVPVKLIWRDAQTLDEGPSAVLAALAGRCAVEQGKFWYMHDALLQTVLLDLKTVDSLSASFLPHPDAFHDCVYSGRYLKAVEDDAFAARDHHITQTPVLFIGDKILTGLTDSSQILAAIQRAAKHP